MRLMYNQATTDALFVNMPRKKEQITTAVGGQGLMKQKTVLVSEDDYLDNLEAMVSF